HLSGPAAGGGARVPARFGASRAPRSERTLPAGRAGGGRLPAPGQTGRAVASAGIGPSAPLSPPSRRALLDGAAAGLGGALRSIQSGDEPRGLDLSGVRRFDPPDGPAAIGPELDRRRSAKQRRQRVSQ